MRARPALVVVAVLASLLTPAFESSSLATTSPWEIPVDDCEALNETAYGFTLLAPFSSTECGRTTYRLMGEGGLQLWSLELAPVWELRDAAVDAAGRSFLAFERGSAYDHIIAISSEGEQLWDEQLGGPREEMGQAVVTRLDIGNQGELLVHLLASNHPYWYNPWSELLVVNPIDGTVVRTTGNLIDADGFPIAAEVAELYSHPGGAILIDAIFSEDYHQSVTWITDMNAVEESIIEPKSPWTFDDYDGYADGSIVYGRDWGGFHCDQGPAMVERRDAHGIVWTYPYGSTDAHCSGRDVRVEAASNGGAFATIGSDSAGGNWRLDYIDPNGVLQWNTELGYSQTPPTLVPLANGDVIVFYSGTAICGLEYCYESSANTYRPEVGLVDSQVLAEGVQPVRHGVVSGNNDLITVEVDTPSGRHVAAIVADANVFPPDPLGTFDPGSGTTRNVAMGDSYSAGQGADDYLPGTNGLGGNECRRSQHAYPVLVAPESGTSLLTFVACTDAYTWHLRVPQFPDTSPPQGPQRDELGPDVELVTITIGGNDVGFRQILIDCIGIWGAEILPFNTCVAEPENTEHRVQDAFALLQGEQPPHGGGFRETIPLDELFHEIRDRAPNARVLVIGYPQFYKAHGTTLFRCSGLKKADQLWINRVVSDFNVILLHAALARDFEFVETSWAFEGHRLCELPSLNPGDWFVDEWFRDLQLIDQGASYHPNARGHQAIADQILRVLQAPRDVQATSTAGLVGEGEGYRQAGPTSRPPTAAIEHTVAGATLHLDGSGSSAATTDISDYRWYIDAPCGTIVELVGAVVDYTFNFAGVYGVTLQVVGEDGSMGFGGLPAGVTIDYGSSPAAGDLCSSTRVADSEPIEAAVRISQQRYPQRDLVGGLIAHPSVAVLARYDDFADALSGSPLSATGPLLFTEPGALPATTLAELQRVVPGGLVYVLGGEAAVSEAVLAELEAAGFRPERLAGDSRVETALAVADQLVSNGPAVRVALARAYGLPGGEPTAAWADAVSAGAWATRVAQGAVTSAERVPILLTPTEGLHPAVRAWLEVHEVETTIVLGGTLALSETVAAQVPQPRRVGGAGRAETAVAVAQQLWDSVRGLTLINGYHQDGWAYGLAAAGLAAERQAPLLMSSADAIPQATATLLQECRGDYGIVVGPAEVLSFGVESQVGAVVAQCHGVT